MEIKINNKKTLCGIIAFAVLLYWGVNHFEVITNTFSRMVGILSPFLLAGAIAFVINVPMKIIEKYLGRLLKKKTLLRFISMFLGYAVAGGLIVFVVMTVIPEMMNTLVALNNGIPVFLDQLNVWVKDIAETYPDVTTYISTIELNWPTIVEKAINILQNGVTNVLASTWGVATSVIGVITTIALGLIFSMYILVQKEKLGTQFKKLVYALLPLKYADRFVTIGTLSNKTFSGFISGQCTEALIFGLLCYIGMVIFRFPYTLSISVLIGFTTLIPVLGAFIGTALGAILILVTSPIQALWFVIFIIVLQQIDENLIYPRVVGSSVGLPGLWVMLAVTLGGSLMGLLGMLIFVPLVSVLYSLLRESVYKRLKKKEVPSIKYETITLPEPPNIRQQKFKLKSNKIVKPNDKMKK